MSRCKRCGTSFDYNERDGVCPRCCFYNRPPGTVGYDDEWAKNYNIEDNSYQLPKSIIEQEDREKSKRIHPKPKSRQKGKSVETGRRVTVGQREKRTKETTGKRTITGEKKAYYSRERQTFGEKEAAAGRRKSLVIGILVVMIFVSVVAAVIPAIIYRVEQKSGSEEAQEFTSMIVDLEDAADGIEAGDTIFYPGEARVLFQEGELPEMPEGEKCIGIMLTADETKVSYDGIYWERPYVFDGKNYRQMVYTGRLANADQFEDLGDGTGAFPYYLSSFSDGMEEGYAIYFVDKDATEVTLSLPCQSQDEKNKDKIYYTGVVDVVIPIGK